MFTKKDSLLAILSIVLFSTPVFAQTGLFFDLEAGMSKTAVRQHPSLPGWFEYYEDRGEQLVFIQRNNFGVIINVFFLRFDDNGLNAVRRAFQFPRTNADADSFLDLRASLEESPEYILVSEHSEHDGETGEPAELRVTREGVELGLRGGPRDVFELVYEHAARNRKLIVNWRELESLTITYLPM